MARFPWPSGKRILKKLKNAVCSKENPTMQKRITYRPSILVFSILIGLLAPTIADCVEDVSGDWSGTWYSNTNQRGGEIFLSLTQYGTIVGGTADLSSTTCSLIFWEPVTGNVIGNILSFEIHGTGCGVTITIEYSNGVIVNNTISGYFVTYINGRNFYGEGPFNVTRSSNTINATAGAGGTITPIGIVSVTPGSDQTFFILADDGFKILDVVVDGISVGPESSYIFRSVSANHTILATFESATNMELPAGVLPLLLGNE